MSGYTTVNLLTSFKAVLLGVSTFPRGYGNIRLKYEVQVPLDLEL